MIKNIFSELTEISGWKWNHMEFTLRAKKWQNFVKTWGFQRGILDQITHEKSYNFQLHNMWHVKSGQPSENLRRQQSLFPLNTMYISTFSIPCQVMIIWINGAHLVKFRIITVLNSQAYLQFTLTFHVMHVNVLNLSSRGYFLICPGTVQLCCSVSLYRGCTDFLSLRFPFQPSKCRPYLACGRMTMDLQGLLNLTRESLLSSITFHLKCRQHGWTHPGHANLPSKCSLQSVWTWASCPGTKL